MHYKEYKTILSANNGMNIFRGCSHGCIYCDSRSKCYNFDHDFCDIEIKTNAASILNNELKRKKKLCMIGTGSMCDPYIPIEKDILYTRKCLEVICNRNFGLSILTKSNLILRDLDLLKKINKNAKCVVQITLTTFNEDLCKIIEPNVSSTKERVEVLNIMKNNKIPTVVWLCPILPYINDTEENLLGILEYCKQSNVWGIINFGFGLTLREGNREYFYEMLDKHFPNLKYKYIKEFGNSYEILSKNNKKLKCMFYKKCKEFGIETNLETIFNFLKEYPNKFEQINMFENF